MTFSFFNSFLNLLQLTLPTNLMSLIHRLAQKIQSVGGRALLVGGCVRDALMVAPAGDADMEVFGVTVDKLEKLLREEARIVAVGKAFGVFKLRDWPLDISLPRRERKSGPGHRGFRIEGDPDLTLQEAASRRDFTLNAIHYDPLTDEVLDSFGGRKDLEQGILRHTSERFSEDSLRVLRAMQFAARFALQIAPETISLCRQIPWDGLPRERVFAEWEKLLVKGKEPSRGLLFLQECGWIRYFPELEALINCPQDPQWHPEGDVWTHTLHCLDAFARERLNDSREDLIVGLAVLCHDLGKPATTFTDENGRIRSPGHDKVGVTPAKKFLERLTNETAIFQEVLPLVEHHMKPADLYRAQAGDGAIRRLASQVNRLDRLIRVVSADMQGSPPKVRDRTPCRWLLEQAEALAVKDARPRPILHGRHLIKLGAKPGRHFSPILEAAFDAQLEGAFDNEAAGMRWLQCFLKEQSQTEDPIGQRQTEEPMDKRKTIEPNQTEVE